MLPEVDFKKDYRSGFDAFTEELKSFGFLKDYVFTEMVMPDGEIQRWWTGHGESLVIKYKRVTDER